MAEGGDAETTAGEAGVTLGALALTALFIVGTFYVGVKVWEDWSAGRRRLIAMGIAAFAGYFIMLSFAAHAVLVAMGF